MGAVRSESLRKPTESPSRSRNRREKTPRREGDMKALKMQRALSQVSYGHRTNIKRKISDIEEFGEFDLLPIIHKAIPEEALKGLVEVSPTPIQKLAIPALLGKDLPRSKIGSKEMKQFLLAAETGSGKTLAYLLPVLDAVKKADLTERQAQEQEIIQKEQKRKENIFHVEAPPLSNQVNEDAGRPKAIILLPTSELVEQVGRVFKTFSHAIKLRTALLSASYTATVIRNRLFGPQGVDIVITTPHLLSSIATSDPNILSRVTHLVADEADSLFDRSFAPLTTSIIDRAAPSLQQLILCSATIPRSLDSYLQKRFPTITRLATPNLHAIPRRVQLSVVDIDAEPYRGNRDLACADTIWQIGRSAVQPAFGAGGVPQTSDEDGSTSAPEPETKRIIVFVNERDTASELSTYLQSKGVDAVALTRDTEEQRKEEILDAFTSSRSSRVASPAPVSARRRDDAGAKDDQGEGGRDAITDASTAARGKTVSVGLDALEAAAQDHSRNRKRTSSATPLPTSSSTELVASPAASSKPNPRQLNHTQVLVTTDITSRGIDTIAVRNVLLYDVPHTTIDFIHRLGRTGRMGRRGRGWVLVGRGDRRDVVREVREGMFLGRALV